jgi:hypothetical protein
MTLNLNRTLCLILLCAVVGACGGDDDGGDDGGDDSGAAVCGDGLINGDEDCDGVLLGGADCVDAGNYTGGTLACTSDCTFDTSGCTADEDCGNGVIEGDEVCDGADLGGASCASVGGGFTGGELACSTECELDTSGCTSSEGSAAIAAARAAPDGKGQTLPVSGVLVTYIKPALGQDPAGIFIQAEQTGPALFVAVDPATLGKVAVGDEVSFTITAMATSAEQRRATALSDFSIDVSGGDVAALVQDVSADDTLVTALADFDSELITLDATVASDFAPAGNPAVAAEIRTAGFPAESGLRFRLDGALRDSLDLANGCSVTIGPTPLWRFVNTPQPSAWDAGDVDITACNPPRVVTAVPTGATSVVVTFDRLIDPATVQPGDFSFAPALAVDAAALTARTVTLTTAAQTPQTNYTVTVTNVNDQRGSLIDDAADTASFVGFGDAETTCDDNVDNDLDDAIDCFDPDCAADDACQFELQLYIWEIDPDNVVNPDGLEFIEIWNNTGAAVNFANEGWYVLLVNGSNDLTYDVIQLGPGTLPADGVWVIGSAAVPGVDQTDFTTDSLQNGADGVLLVNCNTCAGPADFSGDGSGFDPGNGATITSDSGATGQKVDGVAHDTGDPDDPELQAKLGVTAQFDEAGAGDSPNDSLQRTSLGSWFTFDPSAGTFE